MKEQLEQVATAFSRKALVYDEFGKDHQNLTRMRRRVYTHLAQVATGSRLLELNAGTGLDAVALVRRGYRVHATDISPGMVAQIETKIVRYGLQEQLTVQRCSFTQLDRIEERPFAAIFSNFGGLNCINDLTQITRHLPRLLRPGGTVTWVVMPPVCPWELLRVPQDWRVATRRLRPAGVKANVEGVQFLTTYFTPRQVRRAFGPHFQQVKLEGLSVFAPPADNKTFARRHPRLYQFLVRLDERLCRWPPFKGWGDFFVITMKYRPPQPQDAR